MVCSKCAHEYVPREDELAIHGLSASQVVDFHFRVGSGCSECRGSGYRGRRAIAEILTLTDRLREMIAARQPVTAVKEEARHSGTRYLRESALALVRVGETTLEEVARVTLSS